MEDEKLSALLNEKFAEINARFDGVDGQFEGINARLDGLETEVRKVRVDMPELKSMMQRNIELIQLVDEKVERFRGETAENFNDVRAEIRVSNTALMKRFS